ncbi:MAG: beta-N-acetylhexosaminidase [Desulfarculaceae bacterium]|nr:beta-N-acetylhexosaminidase [Desulfarculaceae bacterium]
MTFHPEDIRKTAGQKIMAGFTGTEFNTDIEYLIKELHVGGLILFSRNVESPEQLFELCRKIMDCAIQNGSPPVFISIDQEGGPVARLKPPFTVFPGNPSIKTEEQADRYARTVSRELKSVGFNMNLAPVLDVVGDIEDSVMKDRAFEKDTATVSRLGCRVITGMQQNGIMAVGKHFPGIGRSSVDSHFNLPVVDADLQSLFSRDLPPFREAVKAGAAGIMPGHILYPQLDPHWQASLSEVIIKELLRDTLGYNGLVITDDLDMKAVTHDIDTCAERILVSGTDIALICHPGPDIEHMFRSFCSLMESSREHENSGRASVSRIMTAKKKYLKI